MAAIPAIADFTDSAVTEGEFKTALSGLHDYLTGILGTAGTQPAAQTALGALLGAGVVTRSVAYTVVGADRGKIISCNGSFTVGLTAASTLGAGFAIAVSNVGTGTITIDPNGTETINGAATYTLAANASVIVACSGSNWIVTGDNPFTRVTGTPGASTYLRGDQTWAELPPIPDPNVMGTIAGQSVGAVGTYAFLRTTIFSGLSILPGGTAAGSNLAYSGDGGTVYTAPSGTWRCMGYAYYDTDLNAYRATVFLRIA